MTFDEYKEMMLHYLPKLPIGTIRDAYKHHATPTEVRSHLERIEMEKAEGRVMTDREAFEAWAKEKGIPFHGIERNPEYSVVAWMAWQAATAAERERCAQAVISLEKQQWFPSQKALAEACATVIRKGE